MTKRLFSNGDGRTRADGRAVAGDEAKIRKNEAVIEFRLNLDDPRQKLVHDYLKRLKNMGRASDFIKGLVYQTISGRSWFDDTPLSQQPSRQIADPSEFPGQGSSRNPSGASFSSDDLDLDSLGLGGDDWTRRLKS